MRFSLHGLQYALRFLFQTQPHFRKWLPEMGWVRDHILERV